MMRELTEPQASIKANGVGIPLLRAWEEVKKQALTHLLGADKVVEASVPDTKPLDAVSVIMQAS